MPLSTIRNLLIISSLPSYYLFHITIILPFLAEYTTANTRANIHMSVFPLKSPLQALLIFTSLAPSISPSISPIVLWEMLHYIFLSTPSGFLCMSLLPSRGPLWALLIFTVLALPFRHPFYCSSASTPLGFLRFLTLDRLVAAKPSISTSHLSTAADI